MITQISRALLYPFRLLLGVVLKLLVRPKMSLADPVSNRELPTFYLISRYSLTERLLLQSQLVKQKLPPLTSVQLADKTWPLNLLVLETPPRLGKGHLGPQPTDDLHQLWAFLEANPEQDVQVVPVNFFWGRAPKREQSLLKIITADTWAATSGLQFLPRILLHGRQFWIELGSSVTARSIISQEHLQQRGSQAAAERSQRLLKRYLRRSKTRMLGPDLSHRRTQVNNLMNSPALQQAIAAEAERTSAKKARDTALRYINEITSNVSYTVLLVLERILSRVWNRLYDGVRVQGIEQLRDKAGHYNLVYLPCHRSHIDYLLLSYVLFTHGLMPPHIAAGINLNMPVIGPLLRRGGAFFMRRSFKDNPLYSQVFNEYLYLLLNQGHPVEFFVEGGRSRTGRTLPPKPGMLSMTLKAAQRGTRKPLLLVPVYIGYEKVLEGTTYLGELRGQAKKKESPLDLLRVLRSLRQSFGRVDVSFGQSFTLDEASLQATDPQDFRQEVTRLARQLVRQINRAASLNRTNLVALALLASNHRALEEETLLAQMHTLAALANMQGTLQPEGTPREWLDFVIQLGFVEKIEHSMGPLYRCNQRQGVLLTYYRNNTLHLFALPALLAFLFMNQRSLSQNLILQQAASVYPLLAGELFLSWKADDFEQQLHTTLEQLAQLGLLQKSRGDRWSRCDENPAAHMQLRLLGKLMQPALERIYLLLALLHHHGTGQLTPEQLVAQTQELAERLTILQGLNSPEFSDRRLFDQLIQLLIEQGWLTLDADAYLVFDEKLVKAMHKGQRLFDPQLRHRLLTLTAK